MNRQMKRLQERQERQQKRAVVDRKSATPITARRGVTQEGRKKTSARQFLREVRGELRKVDWPSRRELVTSTVVVLVTVSVLTTFVFVLDLLFSKTILNVLGN